MTSPEIESVEKRMLDLLIKYPEHRDKNGRFWVFLYWREYEDVGRFFEAWMYHVGPDHIQFKITDPDTILRTKRDIQNRQGKFSQSPDFKRTQAKRERETLSHFRERRSEESEPFR